MKQELCAGQLDKEMDPFLSVPLREARPDSWLSYNAHAAKGKRKLLKCPVCGRKLMSSLSNNDDGDVYHSLPPHKPKGWWKRKKKK